MKGKIMNKGKMIIVCLMIFMLSLALCTACTTIDSIIGPTDGTLESLEVDCLRTEYTVGESIDKNTLIVNTVYADGSKATVTGWTMDKVSALEAGDQTITVSYTENGVTVTTKITVHVTATDHVHQYSEVLCSDENGHWYECACGSHTEVIPHKWKEKREVVDEATCTEKGKDIVTCADCGYSQEVVTDALDHDFSDLEHDENGHWYACSRCDATQEVKAHEFTLDVTELCTKWYIGETFSAEEATATITCACGETRTVETSELTYEHTEFTTEEEEKEVTFTYNGSSCTKTISVATRQITGISLIEGYKINYSVGDAFDGATLNVDWQGDVRTLVSVTEDMLSGFETESNGKKKVEVSYEGHKCSFEIRVGYVSSANAYEIPAKQGVYKMQVEDEGFVDLSKAKTQSTGAAKFENTTTLSTGGTAPNGAEGYSTSNISVNGNKIIIRFYTEDVMAIHFGVRGQSASWGGTAQCNPAQVFSLTVNGVNAPIISNPQFAKATTKGVKWKDMLNWNVIDNLTQAETLYTVRGVNEFVLTYLQYAGNLRCPNLDYFMITVDEVYKSTALEVSGTATIPYGGKYTEGLTATVRNGENELVSVPVTASMISGLDTTVAGTQTVTVNYLGLTAACKVTVESKPAVGSVTLTLDGGTFADGKTTKSLLPGDKLPKINWSVTDCLGYAFNETIYTDLSTLTMGEEDATLKAISKADANKLVMPAAIRQNTGAKDTLGKTSQVSSTNATNGESSGDGWHYTLTNLKSTARGITFKQNYTFGEADQKVAVFVSITNNGTEKLSGMSYGTECGIISIGDVEAGATVVGAGTITSDGANHWPNLFWDGVISSADFTIVVYVCPLE